MPPKREGASEYNRALSKKKITPEEEREIAARMAEVLADRSPVEVESTFTLEVNVLSATIDVDAHGQEEIVLGALVTGSISRPGKSAIAKRAVVPIHVPATIKTIMVEEKSNGPY